MFDVHSIPFRLRLVPLSESYSAASHPPHVSGHSIFSGRSHCGKAAAPFEYTESFDLIEPFSCPNGTLSLNLECSPRVRRRDEV